MAVDVFLKLGDIKGESKDAKHAGEIDVLSWSWGVSQTGTMGVGGGGGAGKANFSDLNFMHARRQGVAGADDQVRDGRAHQGGDARVPQGGQGPAGVSDHQDERHPDHERPAVRQQRASDGERVDELRQDRPRVQAAEGRRLARCRAVHFMYDVKTEQGRLNERGPASPSAGLALARSRVTSRTRYDRRATAGLRPQRAGPATCSCRSRAPSPGVIKGEAQDQPPTPTRSTW